MGPKTKESEKSVQQLNIKQTLLNALEEQVSTTLTSKNVRKVKRIQQQLQEKSEECFSLVSRITELKLMEGEDPTNVKGWSRQEEEKLLQCDDLMEDLDDFIRNQQKQGDQEATLRELQLEDDRRLRRLKEEDERLDRQRVFEMELEEKKMKRQQAQDQKAKLPKLQITRFDGTIIDWVRFWEQFEEEIDKCKQYAPITKFSYLRELLTTQPKMEIAGLPFTDDGYKSAKDLLKQKYGKISEVIHAHGQQIAKLPIIQSTNNLKLVHDFYRDLNVSITSLKTLGKLETAEILVRQTLDKLGPIKVDLIRTDPDWQKWGFEKLLEELRGYTIRNPEDSNIKGDSKQRHQSYQDNKVRGMHTNNNEQRHQHYQENRVRGMHTTNNNEKKITCVYCDGENHRSSECNKFNNLRDRKDILKKKRLCYNCTGINHPVSACRSRNCARCNQRHHTSICHLQEETSQQTHQTPQMHQTPQTSLYMIEDSNETIHPTLVVMAMGQKFRVLLDTGAGNSFVSSTFINHLDVKPLYWESKKLETMTTTTTQKLPVYDVEFYSTDGKYSINTKVNKLDRTVLTTLNNPRITQLKKKYPHLAGIHFGNEDGKQNHPIHIILGAGDIARIKASGFIAGKSDEPIAEKTLFGWTLMGQGTTTNLGYLATNTAQDDYRTLYSLDVLGLEDAREGDQTLIHEEFKEQLQRKDDGTYSTGLPWRKNHQFLPDNKAGSIARLNSQLRRLKKTPDVLQEYDNIMKGQIKQGILEQAPEAATGKRVFYMPHRAVIKATAETTKMRIVYDASARENNGSPSLNDCLHTGPALQPLLQDVLLRNRFKPIALLGDIKQAFLQIGIHEEDRDAIRLHWVKDLINKEIMTLRFTCLPFGCAPSPFVLNATLAEHLESYMGENDRTKVIEEIKENLFVDDLTSGGDNVEEAMLIKETAIKVFSDGGFILHKWHSNHPSLELKSMEESNDSTTTFAKEHVATKNTDTKILGVHWNKKDDLIAVEFKSCQEQQEDSKRGVLKAMASVYDPLGIASPLLLIAKQLYRNICDLKITWDKELPNEMIKSWKAWLGALPDMVTIPRSITKPDQKIIAIELHGFGDASKEGCCSAIYAVVHHSEGTTAQLLTAKSRIAKRETSIPRLELIAGHMVVNSLDNVRNALHRYPITATFGWLDSTVALYWILNNNKEWKQFISNRVFKINQKKDITWRHCPTKENPADIGSRGSVTLAPIWFNGPCWLGKKEDWPENIVQPNFSEVDEERKLVKRINFATITTGCKLEPLLEKHNLSNVLRITAWIRRFITNCRTTKKNTGELSHKEIQVAKKIWISKAQQTFQQSERFKEIEERLQLKENTDGILVCMGRISGEYPIYLPDDHPLTKLIAKNAHRETKHGLVSLTMAKVREDYWVERLRRLVKSTIHQCYYCRRYHSKPLKKSGTSNLPLYRTTPTRAFETTGVDFAGPFEYKVAKGEYGKAYLTLFTCATSRAVHLELVKNMEATTFKRCLKEFFARRGNPSLMVSDNAKTFQNAAKWLIDIKNNADLNSWLESKQTDWKFNLSRSPWWGGFFERLVGLSKNVLFKSLGRSRLPFESLRELVIEAEVILNNRPLGYLENDIELPPLTPHMLIHGTNVSIPQQEIDEDPDFLTPTPEKMMKTIQHCKDTVWKRWKSEYLRALRERHFCSNKKEIKLQVGDIVQIKGDQKNRGDWSLAKITKLVKAGDILLGAKLQTRNNKILERPVEFLYPMELQHKHEATEQKDLDGTNKMEALELKVDNAKRNQRAAKKKAIENIGRMNKELLNDDIF
jgi:hypothetical protein